MQDPGDDSDTAAFEWLDEFFAEEGAEEAPDEAFDWICMTTPADWVLLEQVWADRSPAWREACAYILGQGPMPESLPLLRRALFDVDLEVAREAARSLAQQRLSLGAELALDDPVVSRLRELVEGSRDQHLEEVVAVLQDLTT